MATLKNTTIGDTGALGIPRGNSSQRPISPSPRQIRFNTETGTVEQYRNGVNKWVPVSNTGVIATGGDAVYDVDAEGTTYRVHVFTATGTSTFSVLQGGQVEYLIVAGGGGGGGGPQAGTIGEGGGGGAGGLIFNKSLVNSNTYSVQVGDGGQGGFGDNPGSNGGDSSFNGFTALGGGYGGSQVLAANQGGSSGGSGQVPGYTPRPNPATQPNTNSTASIDAGNNGGSVDNDQGTGSGGGGAGGPGGDNTNTPGDTGAVGGLGLSLNITGLSVFYAGGGGGAGRSGGGGAGGLGGGGAGNSGSNPGFDAVQTTGGGGGAGSQANGTATSGGDGGSGIVVIRYPLRQNNPETAAGQDVRNGLVLDLDFAKPTVYSGSGSVVSDSRLNGLEGDILGTTFIESSRTHNSNFRFTGSGSNIDLGRPAAFDREFEQITIEFVTRRTGSADGGVNYSCELVKNGSFYARLNFGAGFQFRSWHTGSGDSYNQTFSSFNYDQWYHMVVTWNGSVKRGYLNGQQVGSEYSESGALVNSSANVIIGARGSTPDTGIDGNIGLCRVYDQALSDTEILQRYNLLKWRFGV